MDKIEELENKIKELASEIERLKEEQGYKPIYEEDYWFIRCDNEAVSNKWYGDNIDEARYELGSVFKTKEEAEFRVEQLKVEAELRRFARPFKIGGKNYMLQYLLNGDKIVITYFEVSRCGNMYFPSREIAQKAIDTVGEDRIKKYYFGVED